MFTIIKDLPKNIIGIRVSGKTTKEDYKLANQLMEAYEVKGEKIKLLIQVEEFDYSAGALWEDFKFSFKHLGIIKAMAVVSEKDWMDKGFDVFGKLMPGVAAQGFEADEYEKALLWLQQQ